MDYLDWRGDLTFREAPFNEVDNLILAQLVYVEFAGIVPAPGEEGTITVKEACELFFAAHDRKEIMERVSMTKTAAFVLEKMAQTERFCNAQLFGYINDISKEEQSQFSVVCVRLDDKSIYVSFSGTDNTIVGWRENFNMGYLSETPGQLKAVDYLNHMVKEDWKKIRVGGHSKGGNLSVYASVKCDRNIQKRIVKVYSNDGPGFSEEMIQSKEYQRMLPKIKTILPESSIVGMLLEHQEKFEVVKSSQSGIQQHDAMSWEVLGSHFVYVEEVAPQSILLDETMKKWIFQLTKEQREEIVDTVFSMLDDAKIYTVDDFYNSKWKKVQELMKAKSKLSPETQELFSQALRMLWKTGNQTVKKSVKQAVLEKVEEANSLFSNDKSKKSMKSSKITLKSNRGINGSDGKNRCFRQMGRQFPRKKFKR